MNLCGQRQVFFFPKNNALHIARYNDKYIGEGFPGFEPLNAIGLPMIAWSATIFHTFLAFTLKFELVPGRTWLIFVYWKVWLLKDYLVLSSKEYWTCILS